MLEITMRANERLSVLNTGATSTATSQTARNDVMVASGDSMPSQIITPADLTAALAAVPLNHTRPMAEIQIPANLGEKPKLDEHLQMNPKEIQKVKGRSHDIYLLGGYQYLRDKPVKTTNAVSYFCQQKRDGCRGRIHVFPDGSHVLKHDHKHDPSITKSKVFKVSYIECRKGHKNSRHTH